MASVAFLFLTILLMSCSNEKSRVVKSPHIEAELVSEQESIQPGKRFWVALRVKMDEGWHVNWVNPGDAGLPPSIDWKLPEGFTAGEIQWPSPKRLPLPPLVLFGYTDQVLFPVEITPSPDLSQEKSVMLSAACDWVVCGDVCLPGAVTVTLELPVKNGAPQNDENWKAEFVSTRENTPIVHDFTNVQASLTEELLVIQFNPIQELEQPIESIAFFPEIQGLIDNAAEQMLFRDSTGYRLEIKRDKMVQAAPDTLKGVLLADKSWLPDSDRKAIRIELPLSVRKGT